VCQGGDRGGDPVGRGVGRVGHAWWTRAAGPMLWAGPNEQCQILFKQKFQIVLNLNQTIGGLPQHQKFQIKYGFGGFVKRNNFPYRKFLRFKVEFELKFREPIGVKFN
jgi:hypothetical protein